MSVEVQWRVTWFPDDKPQDVRVLLAEENARSLFNTMKERGHAPILERRELPEWEIVENAAS